MSRQWPPANPDHHTPQPRAAGLDLTDAADHLADEIREAAKRRDGYQLGQPVRRRK